VSDVIGKVELNPTAPPADVVAAIQMAVSQAADEQVRTLKAWVETDSPTEEKTLVDEMGGLIAREAQLVGLETTRLHETRYGDHLLARGGDGASTSPKVMLIGHFDTVYAKGTAAARGFKVVGERGVGPGALDMKGGIIVGLFALRALRSALGNLPLQVTFLFNSDEEVGSPTSRVPLLAEAPSHDLVVVLEPGKPGQKMVLGRKGVGIVNFTVEGIEAHAGAEPENGANAIVAMASHVRALSELQDLSVGTTVTPGTIHGGTHPYVVPGNCRLGVDMRVPTRDEQARLEAALTTITASVPVPRTRTTMTGGFHRPPMEPSDRTHAAFRGLAAAGSAIGYEIAYTTTGGASDGNLTAAAGVPTLDGMGPAGRRAHSNEEYIEMESFFRKTELLAVYLAALAGVKDIS